MNKTYYLIYIHKIGESWDGLYHYQFLFSDTTEDIDGEYWDKIPASGDAEPPKQEYVQIVGDLKTDILFDVIQDSDTYAVWDAVDGITALGWENIDDYEVYPDNRLHFHFGDTLKSVQDKLYSRDNILSLDGENED